jgi:hypothetical protein
LFVVPNGELESWLKSLKARGHGPSWLVEVFEKMGDKNPTIKEFTLKYPYK